MALKQTLARNVIVEVLTQKRPKSLEFKKVIDENATGLAFIRTASSYLVKNRLENFAIMDMRAFRYEPDKSEERAVACANEPLSVAILDSNFSKLLAKA